MSYGEIATYPELLGYYKFNGNANDSGSYGRDMTAVGPLTYSNGRYGQGIQLAVTPTYVEAYDYCYFNNNMGIDGGPVTISIWVKNPTWPGNFPDVGGFSIFINQWSANSCNGYRIWLAETGLYFTRDLYNIRSDEANYSGYRLYREKFSHLVLTYDGAYIMGYVDGVLKALPVASTGSGVGSVPNVTTIGAFTWDAITWNHQPSNTTIDEVIIEGRAWSATEIQKYYSQAVGRFCPKEITL